jgi:hypothetical protein
VINTADSGTIEAERIYDVIIYFCPIPIFASLAGAYPSEAS